MNNVKSVKHYTETNKSKIIEELFGLLRIPSVSARPEHKKDMKTAFSTCSFQFCLKKVIL